MLKEQAAPFEYGRVVDIPLVISLDGRKEPVLTVYQNEAGVTTYQLKDNRYIYYFPSYTLKKYHSNFGFTGTILVELREKYSPFNVETVSLIKYMLLLVYEFCRKQYRQNKAGS